MGEDKPKEIERKVDTYLNRRQVAQQTDKGGNIETRRVNTTQSARQTSTSKTTNQATRQSQQSKSTTQQNKQTTQPSNRKNGASSSWTNFFKRIKDGVTGFFE